MRLTLELAWPNRPQALAIEHVDLGEIAFIEIQAGWINAFVNTSDDPDAPDPDVKYMVTISSTMEWATIWHLRTEDMDVTNDNWVWRARRVNVLNA